MTRRQLWLLCESGRVVGAAVDDVGLLLELLESPAALREAVKPLRRAFPRPRALCVMRPAGLHVVLPGPLAEWLADVARRSDADIDDLRQRLERWLAGDSKHAVAQRSPSG